MRIKLIPAAAAFIIALSFCSCSAFSKIPMLSTGEELYAGEEIISNPDTEGETAQILTEKIKIISAFSVDLTEFNTPRQAARIYRDEMLLYLLNDNYAKYSGNNETIGTAEKKYPHLSITVIIPKEDFEAFVYKNFGGERSVKHESGTVFTYLGRVNAYTSATQASANSSVVHINSLYETKNTYVMDFYNSLGTENSAVFRALFIKREDKTVYLSAVKRLADKRIEAPKEHADTTQKD